MRLTFLSLQIIVFMGWLLAAHSRADSDNLFGKNKETQGESALMGIFYDLKQTQDRKPITMDHPAYFKAIEDFVNGGWDESILNKYYRSSTPLYTTQFMLASIPSEMAPKAFGVDKYCQGGFWLAHYKGQVTPPKDGTYRFVGWSDCQIVVAVNGKLALVASYWKDKPMLNVSCERAASAFYPGGEGLKAGPWFDMKASEPVDLDVLWGDNGGICSCFLLVQEKGANYALDSGGYPILPVFQVAPYNTPDLPATEPLKFSHTPSVWRAWQ